MPLESRHLTPADYRVMPWKNGQGTTTEIAAFPPGAGLDTFTWRISIADIATSGPFSSFPGIDRIVLQTAGDPMTLHHEGHSPRRLTLLSPVRFPGELVTRGEVPTPPVRDFNVMTRRDSAHASVAVHELAPGSTVRVQGAATARIIHVLHGSLSLRSLRSLPTASSEMVHLSPGDTWLLTANMEDDTSFELSVPPAAPVATASLAPTAPVAVAIAVDVAAVPAVDHD